MLRKISSADDLNDEFTSCLMLDVLFALLLFVFFGFSFEKQSTLEIHGSKLMPAPHDMCVCGPPPISVQINAKQDVSINGESTDVRLVKSKMILAQAQHPDVRVVFAVDSQARVGTIISVLDGLRQAGVVVPSIYFRS